MSARFFASGHVDNRVESLVHTSSVLRLLGYPSRPSQLLHQVAGPQRKLKVRIAAAMEAKTKNAGVSYRNVWLLLIGDMRRYENTAAQTKSVRLKPLTVST